ncbi:MAG: sulfur carrier protein ThiS [Actinomycetota bacterium]|nr:sulfur carrier protein ThiS [Actinomycetota bacterium]
MNLSLNGERRELPEGATVADAVRASGMPALARGIAVAVDGEVVPGSTWEETPLAEGQRIEVVQAVQGG